MLIHKTVIVTALAVFTAILASVSSVAAVPGGLLDEEESGVVTETGAAPTLSSLQMKVPLTC